MPLGERYNRLLDISPLHICREFEYLPRSFDFKSKVLASYYMEKRKEIEALLLQYGATEFGLQEEMSKMSLTSTERADSLTTKVVA